MRDLGNAVKQKVNKMIDIEINKMSHLIDEKRKEKEREVREMKDKIASLKIQNTAL